MFGSIKRCINITLHCAEFTVTKLHFTSALITFLFFLLFSWWLHVPSFSITLISVLLLFFPSFPISPCKTTSSSPLWILLHLTFFLPLCSFSLTNLMSFPWSVFDLLLLKWILHSHVHISDKVFVGLNGQFPLSLVLNRGSIWNFACHYASAWALLPRQTLFPMEYQVTLFTVCKLFDQSWCSCLKSSPNPELDPDLNPPHNLFSWDQPVIGSNLAHN